MRYGGHRQAAGFTIEESKIPELKKRLLEKFSTMHDVHNLPKRVIDIECVLSPRADFTIENLDIIMADDMLEEIAVNGSKQPISVYHKKHGWLITNIKIVSESRIRHFATIIGRDVGKEITINYGTSAKPLSVKAHAIAFNPRGGLYFPTGSTPIVMRVAEGTYRNGTPVAYKRGESQGVTESRLKIGRGTARPYSIDG